MNWQQLDLLGQRFAANCHALMGRDARLAQQLLDFHPDQPYALAAEGEQLHIARMHGERAEVMPARVSVLAAQQIAQKLCPTNKCVEAIVVAGIDQGWLWQALYQLPCAAPLRSGHTPPLYLLANSFENLWISCHLHDWRKLLADGRVRLLAGIEGEAFLLET